MIELIGCLTASELIERQSEGMVVGCNVKRMVLENDSRGFG